MTKKLSIQLILVLLTVVVVGYFATPVLTYCLIAGILTFFAQPFRRLWEKTVDKQQTKNGLVAMLSMVSLVVVFTLLFAVFIPLILREAEIIKNIDTERVLEHLKEPMEQLKSLAQVFVPDLTVNDVEKYAREKIVSFLNYSNISNLFAAVSGLIGNLFIALFSVLFITFFFLKEQKYIIRFIENLFPENKRETFVKVFKQSRNLLKRYLIGVALEVLLIIIIVSVGCYILGVENAILIGFFAGIFNIIPYVGPLIGLVFGLVIGLTTELNEVYFSESLPTLLKIGSVILAAQLLDNIVFQPLIYSTSVKAHPLEIFLVILIAGNMFGIAGMILAVPTYTILRLFVKEYLHLFNMS